MKMKLSMMSLLIIFVLVLSAPIMTDITPAKTNPSEQFSPPRFEHILGTDYLGRDVWSRILYGGRRSLMLAALATMIGVVLGTFLGVIAGGDSSLAQKFFLLLIDALLAFPMLVLALVILTLLGQENISLILAIGIPQIPLQARSVYGATVSIRNDEYMLAATSFGATQIHTLWTHILPGIRPTIIAYGALIFGYSLLNGAALSFLLGLSSDPTQVDWGIMLSDGRIAFRQAPWVALAPGICITVTVAAVNRLADHFYQR